MGCCQSGVSIDHIDDFEPESLDPRLRYKRVAIIGPWNCGKTTLIKQLCFFKLDEVKRENKSVIHQQQKYDFFDINAVYDEKNIFNLNNHKPIEIADALLSDIKLLCKLSKDMNIKMEKEENEEYRSMILLNDNDDSKTDNLMAIQSLYKDTAIQSIFHVYQQNGKKIFNIADIDHFVNKIENIFDVDYLKNDKVRFDDFHRIKTKNNGYNILPIMSYRFDQEFVIWEEIHDINELKDDTDGIIFIMDISKHGILNENEKKKPIDLWQSILHKKCVKKRECQLTVFLNKMDILKRRLENEKNKDINEYYKNVCNEYRNVFNQCKNKQNDYENIVHIHGTSTIDTDQIEAIICDYRSDMFRYPLQRAS